MKKVLSLVLVMCMAFSCLALSACVWEGIFGTTTSTVPTASTTQPTTKPTSTTTATTTATTTTTTTTTIINPDNNEPEDLVIQHGDNFTEEDIEFVKSLQGRTHYMGDPDELSIPKMLNNVREGYFTLYLLNVNVDQPYYISAYLDNSIYTDSWKYDNFYSLMNVSDFVWHKTPHNETIPNEIEDTSLVWTFVVFDCVIEKEVIYGTEYDHHCKYYIQCDDTEDILLIRSAFLLGNDITFLLREDSQFIDNRYNQYKTFDLYLDDNGIEYLSFTTSSYYDANYGKDCFGEYYDLFSPYFITIEETINEQGEIYRQSGLELSIIVDILAIMWVK